MDQQEQEPEVDYLTQLQSALAEFFDYAYDECDDEGKRQLIDKMKKGDPRRDWMVNKGTADISKIIEDDINQTVSMKDIYNTFKPTDDFQGTVYLTDGVWVNPDGSMTSN